jgi:hypothetical protein
MRLIGGGGDDIGGMGGMVGIGASRATGGGNSRLSTSGG